VLIAAYLMFQDIEKVVTQDIFVITAGVDKNATRIMIEASAERQVITKDLTIGESKASGIISLPHGTWKLIAIAKDNKNYTLNDATIMFEVASNNPTAKLYFYGHQLEDTLLVNGSSIQDMKQNNIELKGFGLTNGVYTIADPAELEASQFFLKRDDYRTMSEFGVNSVRFYLQYHWLDKDNQEAFFEYFDKQIQYARENGIYIVLNLHFLGMAEDVAKKKADGFYRGGQYAQYNLVDFWDTISERYRYEPVIGAYDLINEANCHNGFTESQLYETYMTLINVIRANKDNHIVIVSDPVAKFDHPSANYHNIKGPFKKLEDTNIAYEYHWYQPGEFTHQAAFYDQYNDLGASYPFSRHKESYKGGYYGNAYWNKTKNNDWQLYHTRWVNLSEQANCDVAISSDMFSVSLSGGSATGRIWFDDIVIEEKSYANGQVKRLFVANADISKARNYDGWNPTPNLSNNPSRWYAYNNEESTGINFEWDRTNDHTGNGSGSLLIDGRKAVWKSRNQWATWGQSGGSLAKLYPIKEGHAYRASSWIKMKNNPGYNAGMSFNIHKVKKEYVNKAFMKKAINSYYGAWAKENNVPIYCGEFGLTDPSRMQFTKDAFTNEEQIQWITDMLDILKSGTTHWAYHTYKNYSFRPDLFGLYDENMHNEPLQRTLRVDL